jgi:hypothetical protein
MLQNFAQAEPGLILEIKAGINRCAIDPSLGVASTKINAGAMHLTFFIFRISLRLSLDSF